MDLTLYTSFNKMGSSFEYNPGEDFYEEEDLILYGNIWNTDDERFKNLACSLSVYNTEMSKNILTYANEQEISEDSICGYVEISENLQFEDDIPPVSMHVFLTGKHYSSFENVCYASLMQKLCINSSFKIHIKDLPDKEEIFAFLKDLDITSNMEYLIKSLKLGTSIISFDK